MEPPGEIDAAFDVLCHAEANMEARDGAWFDRAWRVRWFGDAQLRKGDMLTSVALHRDLDSVEDLAMRRRRLAGGATPASFTGQHCVWFLWYDEPADTQPDAWGAPYFGAHGRSSAAAGVRVSQTHLLIGSWPPSTVVPAQRGERAAEAAARGVGALAGCLVGALALAAASRLARQESHGPRLM